MWKVEKVIGNKILFQVILEQRVTALKYLAKAWPGFDKIPQKL